MENEMDDLKNIWQQAKQSIPLTKTSSQELITSAESKIKKIMQQHYGTIGVLSATVAVLIFYFYYLVSFKEIMSLIGSNLMIGSLIVRIVLEIFSAIRSKAISISDTTTHSLQALIAFHNFRKKIHGRITLIIIASYIIGFYSLTPEMAKYIDFKWMILMHFSAIIGAFIVYKIIKHSISTEMKEIENLVEIRSNLVEQ